MAFNELGIEVEFSGRDENERGVIIDIDEKRALIALGLNLDLLRFGQTVVKVDPNILGLPRLTC
jgi:GDPmannose 4,6-dehydratase